MLFSFALLVLLLRLVFSGLLLWTFAVSGLLFSFGSFFALRGIALLRLRQKDCLPSQRAVMGLVAAGCAVVFVVGLVQGIPPLLAGLGV